MLQSRPLYERSFPERALGREVAREDDLSASSPLDLINRRMSDAAVLPNSALGAKAGLNACFWHEANIRRTAEMRQQLGVKQKTSEHRAIDAHDP